MRSPRRRRTAEARQAIFLAPQTFGHILEVKAIADAVEELARKKAAEYGIPQVCTLDEMLVDPEIEIVVNLTNPAAHAPINLKELYAGKHV
jgi:predicted dehydrogenase